MPPLGMHLVLARQLAPELAHEALSAEPGAYYLGASAPDIRALTRCDRSETHFFDLDCFDDQSGVQRLFQAHPELADPASLSERTVAFLCGYLSHLEMDEAWITDIYRPCFGERSPLQGDLFANLLDRVLQHELHTRDLQDGDAVARIRDELLAATVEEVVGFIGDEELDRWREIAADMLVRPRTWERFAASVGRHLRPFGVEAEADIAHFLRNVPDLIDQAYREVTAERLEQFQERSRRRALDALRAFLS
jgi:hypothetical protein